VFGAQSDTINAGPGTSTIVLGSGADTVNLTAGHGAATLIDVGITGTDTVTGFAQGQDFLHFSGQTTTSRDAVIAAQTHPTANTTVLTFPDNTTMTLIGITNVDQTFFK
jgi:hypothetical protein